MRKVLRGVLFIPTLGEGVYKYEIKNKDGHIYEIGPGFQQESDLKPPL